MSFVRSTFLSKTGIFGVLAIVLSLVGLVPAVGMGFSVELLMLGVAMITIRHTLYKQDVTKLDPVLDRLLGDRASGVTQELLIALLEAKDDDTVAEVKERAVSTGTGQ